MISNQIRVRNLCCKCEVSERERNLLAVCRGTGSEDWRNDGKLSGGGGLRVQI